MFTDKGDGFLAYLKWWILAWKLLGETFEIKLVLKQFFLSFGGNMPLFLGLFLFVRVQYRGWYHNGIYACRQLLMTISLMVALWWR